MTQILLVDDHEIVRRGLRMLLAEARVAADLRHSNVAQVLDLGIQDGLHFIVMEFLHGQNLHRSRPRIEATAIFANDTASPD